MLRIPDAFRGELSQQIRRPGHCRVTFFYKSGGGYIVPEALIKTVELQNIGDPMSRRLPTEKCTITLLDYERLWDPATNGSYLLNTDGGVRAEVSFGIETQNGQTVWSDVLNYELNGKCKWKNFTATFEFVSWFGVLQTVEFDSIKSSTNTLIELAWDAIRRGVNSLQLTNGDIEMSISLSDIPVIKNIDITKKTVADVLLAVAFASGLSLRGAGMGLEILNHFHLPSIVDSGDTSRTELNPAVIRESDILSEPTFERLPSLKDIKFTYYEDPPSNAARETVCSISNSTTQPTLTNPTILYFSKPIVDGTLQYTGTNVNSVGMYVYRNRVEIYEVLLQSNSAPYSITFTGCPIQEVKKGGQWYGADGEEDEILENLLLNEDNCYYVHDMNTPWYTMPVPFSRSVYYENTRDLYEFSYRGDPSIQHLDLITVELPVYGFCQCVVIESYLKYENGFSGKLKVRRIENPNSLQTRHCAISDYAISDHAISDSMK